MKKFFLIIALLVCTGSLFAQGGLTIINNTQCAIWVKMLGVSATSGDPAPCQLNSNTFLVPPSTTWTWCNVYDFQGPGPGCGRFGTSIPPVIGWAFGSPILFPPVTTDFQWSDVTFQWDRCSDCNEGGIMGNSGACAVPSTCWGGLQTWASPPPGIGAMCTTIHTATWVPACLLPAGNLTLTFN